MAGEDAKSLAILCDGATGHFDALLIEEGGELVIAERLMLGLLLDELGDCVFHASVAHVFPRIGFHAVSEKVLQLKDAVWRGDVFTSDGAADSRLMHTHIGSHGSHVEGFEMAEPLIEKVTLVAEDLSGDLVNGLLALVNAANEKFSPTDLVAHMPG